MTAFNAWCVFPAVLVLLSLGLGLLVDACAGSRLPRTVLLPLGFATFIVLAQYATAWHATALLAMPLVALLATVGAALGWRRLRGSGPRFGAPLTAAVAAYLAYLLPVAMSGTPTFAGWIKLDDGATWLAFADRLVEAGRTLAGLAPSTYEALLKINLVDGNPAGSAGYPVGAFVPMGGVARLVGIDAAWTLQPYMAFMAGLLAIMAFVLLRDHIVSPWLRAGAAVVSASSALLYGYALWGGVKELALAPLIALTVWAATYSLLRGRNWRSCVPLAMAASALLAVAGPSGITWAIPALLVAAVGAARRDSWRIAGLRLAVSTGLTIALSVPALLLVHFVGLSGLAKFAATSTDIGNLWGHLNFLQVLGVWPVGDFRQTPAELGPLLLVFACIVLLAALGIWHSMHIGRPEIAVLTVSAVAFAGITAFGNAWVGGKALAIASPFVLVATFAGMGWLLRRGHAVEAVCAIVLVAGGVTWSDALAYREAWLAPYAQLRELETIGQLPQLQGPTLYTDPSVYGARHFLRRLNTEGASDLRRNVIPLVSGSGLEKGQFADIDAFALSSVEAYRTLVLRSGANASRPPSNYRLAWKGKFYEVWERMDTAPSVQLHGPLGSVEDPAAFPPCAAMERLIAQSSPKATLAYVERAPVITLPMSPDALPRNWISDVVSGSIVPVGSGRFTLSLDIPAAGEYGVWLSGAFRGGLEISIDDDTVIAAEHWLNPSDTQLPGTRVALEAGHHVVTVRYTDALWRPGNGGSPFAFGPLVLAPSTTSAPVQTVAASQAAFLCGRSLDWIEVLAP